MVEEAIHKQAVEELDSVEIDLPGNNGRIKVCHNANDIERFKRKIINMFKIRDFVMQIYHGDKVLKEAHRRNNLPYKEYLPYKEAKE